MENQEDLTGQLARLLDGQRIRVEIVHADGYVSARRVDGGRKGTIAVYAIGKLEPVALIILFFDL
jgi:hypothetical protein